MQANVDQYAFISMYKLFSFTHLGGSTVQVHRETLLLTIKTRKVLKTF